jgi:hypothetical protein
MRTTPRSLCSSTTLRRKRALLPHACRLWRQRPRLLLAALPSLAGLAHHTHTLASLTHTHARTRTHTRTHHARTHTHTTHTHPHIHTHTHTCRHSPNQCPDRFMAPFANCTWCENMTLPILGMVGAIDESLANISAALREVGLSEKKKEQKQQRTVQDYSADKTDGAVLAVALQFVSCALASKSLAGSLTRSHALAHATNPPPADEHVRRHAHSGGQRQRRRPVQEQLAPARMQILVRSRPHVACCCRWCGC